MEEKYEGGEIKLQSPLMKKIENFWYHYKWHSLIALFFVLVVVICSVQMCNREEYDIHILYAGTDDIRMTATEGLSEYRVLHSSLKSVIGDYDGNGEVTPNLRTMFVPSEEEIEKINQQHKEQNTGQEVQTQVVIENAEELDGLMTLSDYYLCFLSEANYLVYRAKAENFFVSLTPYVGNADVTYYEGATNAVYLHSTALGTLPGFKDLDEGTLICLRSVSEVAKRANRKNSEKQFARAEKTLRNMFSSLEE